MQRREIGMAILFTILTCGIYGIYWFICLTNEVNEVTGNSGGTSGGMAFLFTVLTCGIYGYFWAYKMGEAMETAWQQSGLPSDSNMKIIYLVLNIFGLGIVTYALLQNDLNKYLEGAR